MTSREVFRVLGLIPKVGFQGISFHNDNNNNLLICLVNVVTINIERKKYPLSNHYVYWFQS